MCPAARAPTTTTTLYKLSSTLARGALNAAPTRRRKELAGELDAAVGAAAVATQGMKGRWLRH